MGRSFLPPHLHPWSVPLLTCLSSEGRWHFWFAHLMFLYGMQNICLRVCIIAHSPSASESFWYCSNRQGPSSSSSLIAFKTPQWLSKSASCQTVVPGIFFSWKMKRESQQCFLGISSGALKHWELGTGTGGVGFIEIIKNTWQKLLPFLVCFDPSLPQWPP